MRRTLRVIAVLVMCLLVAAGCRGADETDTAGGGGDEAASPAAGASEAEAAGELTFAEGVTEEPCPDAVNPDNGCIYLGVISDFTGTFAGLGAPIAEAVEAFWNRVNEEGGIGGFDVDAATYVRDNGYNPETHNEVYQEIKPEVLAIAMSLGSPTTAAIYDDLEANSIVTVPAGWTSNYVFQDLVLEYGTSYCVESMNAVMAIHYPGDYGADAAYGAKVAAEELGAEFVDVETEPGQDNQAGAIDAVVSQDPDLVVLTTGPTDAATIIGQAAAQGFQGQYVGTSPTWNPGLKDTPAFDAMTQQYHQSRPGETYEEGQGPGFDAVREVFGDAGDDGVLTGWTPQYAVKAAIEAAIENGDLTREGLLEAATSLESVDYEGMMPEGSGDFAAGEAFPREIIMAQPDAETSSGVTAVTDFITSDVAEGFDYGGQPCWQQL
jgi:ABC-type branched-subunit amino acid transport system substrate-binding protein